VYTTKAAERVFECVRKTYGIGPRWSGRVVSVRKGRQTAWGTTLRGEPHRADRARLSTNQALANRPVDGGIELHIAVMISRHRRCRATE
jgi:hypothetical protein